MAEDRIARIRELWGEDTDDAERSARRWEAAKLIWEELQTGKAQAVLAKDIGRSPAHVTWMKRCWEFTVVKPGLEFGSFADLPPFNELYASDTIRQPNGPRQAKVTEHKNDGKWDEHLARKAQATSTAQRGHRAPERDDSEEPEHQSVAGRWIATAASAIDSLATHSAAWQFATAEDVAAAKTAHVALGRAITAIEKRRAA